MKRIIQCSNSQPIFLPQCIFFTHSAIPQVNPKCDHSFPQPLIEKCYFSRFLGGDCAQSVPLPSTILSNHYPCGHSCTRSTAHLNHGDKWHHFLHVFLQFWQIDQFTSNDFVIRQFSTVGLKKRVGEECEEKYFKDNAGQQMCL